MKVFDDEKFNFKTTINMLVLIMIISGFFGFIYETIFYRIDLGYFVKRGSTFGPWIPIYAFGGIFIVLATYRLRKKPILVFFLNCMITGILEYGTGFVLYEFFHTRLWDYNTEIWNWGNVNGYICFRSIAFFGLSSLFLIYVLIPLLKRFVKKVPEKQITMLSGILGATFLIDMMIYTILRIG